MGWRDIRKQTNRKLGRIDRALYEKQRKMSEVTTLVGQGVSLFDKWAIGRQEQKALEQFGTSEGLTYDKKTKSFYGRIEGKAKGTLSSEEWTDDEGNEFWSDTAGTADQYYKISGAELKNMQNFQKYTDTSIKDMVISDGTVKKGWGTDLSELDSATAGDVRAGETMDDTMKNLQNQMQTTGTGGLFDESGNMNRRNVPKFVQDQRDADAKLKEARFQDTQNQLGLRRYETAMDELQLDIRRDERAEEQKKALEESRSRGGMPKSALSRISPPTYSDEQMEKIRSSVHETRLSQQDEKYMTEHKNVITGETSTIGDKTKTFKGHVFEGGPRLLPAGIEEPSQESESGGVDPNPKGKSLWQKFTMGLEEGATYNEEVPWDVVKKEKDISAERNGGKPLRNWQL